MKTICISSSLKFKSVIRETIDKLQSIGITANFPNLDSGPENDELSIEMIQSLCHDHFQAIDSSKALYVINPDGYIGTMVTIEIGYALGKGKPVYFSEEAKTPDLNALCQKVIPLDSLNQFISL